MAADDVDRLPVTAADVRRDSAAGGWKARALADHLNALWSTPRDPTNPVGCLSGSGPGNGHGGPSQGGGGQGVVLVGHSQGAGAVLRLLARRQRALRGQPAVRGLVLVSAGHTSNDYRAHRAALAEAAQAQAASAQTASLARSLGDWRVLAPWALHRVVAAMADGGTILLAHGADDPVCV
jgi:alpha-beta hydrolase superfamily lysophospholipase